MEIYQWNYDRKNIADYPEIVKDSELLLPANGANAAIYDLIQVLKPGHRVLDIGCGSFSFLKEHLPNSVTWDGIDVFETDDRGRESIATKLGSVDAIPFQNESFDFVMCNQSIEHWYEYEVDMAEGLQEIARVLKTGGCLHTNFPLYLHGHPWFVMGDVNAILSIWDKSTWEVEDVVGFEDWSVEDYHGWERCKFPCWYVSKFAPVSSSFTCAIVARKTSSAKDKQIDDPENRPLRLSKRKFLLARALTHGLRVTAWKVARKTFGNKISAKRAS